MKFVVDGTEYEMVQDNVTFAEARAIEKQTGHSFQALMSNPELQGSMDVTQALMWVSMKRVNPTLLFSDLDDMQIGDIEYVEDEADKEAAALAALPTGADVDSSAETISAPSA